MRVIYLTCYASALVAVEFCVTPSAVRSAVLGLQDRVPGESMTDRLMS